MNILGLWSGMDALKQRIINESYSVTPVTVYGLTLILGVLSLLPVFLATVAPSNDLYYHMAELALNVRGNTEFLRDWFSVGIRLNPNIAMEMLVLFLAKIMSLERATQVFLALGMLLTLTGVMVLHRTIFRVASLWPLISGLFLYNWILLIGFVNYLFGLGVMLWAIAVYLRLRPRAAQIRIAVTVPLSLFLYLCHLLPFVLYGIVLAVFELGEWLCWECPDWRSLVRNLAILASNAAIPAGTIPSNHLLASAEYQF